MSEIVPQPGETPMDALLRMQAESKKFFEWDESDFVPCTPEEAAAGLREAIVTAREKGWIPAEDPGCECLTCRMFRPYLPV